MTFARADSSTHPWAKNLRFSGRAHLVIALGELLLDGTPTPMPNNVLITGSREVASAFRPPSALGSAWADDVDVPEHLVPSVALLDLYRHRVEHDDRRMDALLEVIWDDFSHRNLFLALHAAFGDDDGSWMNRATHAYNGPTDAALEREIRSDLVELGSVFDPET